MLLISQGMKGNRVFGVAVAGNIRAETLELFMCQSGEKRETSVALHHWVTS